MRRPCSVDQPLRYEVGAHDLSRNGAWHRCYRCPLVCDASQARTAASVRCPVPLAPPGSGLQQALVTQLGYLALARLAFGAISDAAHGAAARVSVAADPVAPLAPASVPVPDPGEPSVGSALCAVASGSSGAPPLLAQARRTLQPYRGQSVCSVGALRSAPGADRFRATSAGSSIGLPARAKATCTLGCGRPGCGLRPFGVLRSPAWSSSEVMLPHVSKSRPFLPMWCAMSGLPPPPLGRGTA